MCIRDSIITSNVFKLTIVGIINQMSKIKGEFLIMLVVDPEFHDEPVDSILL
jgi:hypothetical protein